MNLNPLGIDAGAIVRSLAAAPVALLNMPRNIGRIVDSARVLPEVAANLEQINDRVDVLNDEVSRMRRGVDTLNTEVIGVREGVEPIESEFGALREALSPLSRIPRLGRRSREVAPSADET